MPRHLTYIAVGSRFGKLVVGAPEMGKRQMGYACQCDCGNTTNAGPYGLIHARVISCGCVKRASGSRLRHGHARKGAVTAEHKIWQGMMTRCSNKNEPAYACYGARGITVCDRWLLFENFLSDMGERPSAAHSIDRYPDNNGNYEPGNCRWATSSEQARNRRSSRIIEINGKSMVFADAADRFGVPYGTAKTRIAEGWSPEEAFGLAPRKQRRTRVTVGDTLRREVLASTEPTYALALRLGASRPTIRKIRREGTSP